MLPWGGYSGTYVVGAPCVKPETRTYIGRPIDNPVVPFGGLLTQGVVFSGSVHPVFIGLHTSTTM